MKIKYYVNEDERTVVCALVQCHDDAYKYIIARIPGYIPKTFLQGRMDMPDKFIGKSVCAPGDTWDRQYGCQLAYFRAIQKYDRSFSKVLVRFINAFFTEGSEIRKILYNQIGKFEKSEDNLGRKLYDKERMLGL